MLKIYRYLICFFDKQCRKHLLKYMPSDIFLAGTNFTFITKKYIIKIPNYKRIDFLNNEFDSCKLFEVCSKSYEKQQFEKATNKEAFFKGENVLFLEKIDAKPLSYFLDNAKFLVYFNNMLEKLNSLYLKYGFIHSDLHVDNVLVSENDIYFIDFDYKFKESVEDKHYIDILHVVFLLKKEYPTYFLRYKEDIKNMIFNMYDREKLQNTYMKNNCFFMDYLDEFFR